MHFCKKCGGQGKITKSHRVDYGHCIDCESCGYGSTGEDLERICDVFTGKGDENRVHHECLEIEEIYQALKGSFNALQGDTEFERGVRKGIDKAIHIVWELSIVDATETEWKSTGKIGGNCDGYTVQ